MPIGEIETHPYLELGIIPDSNKLILGSFPVYNVTDPDNVLKQQNREINGAFRFFYGSHHSSLWSLYKEFVDPDLPMPFTTHEILSSLSSFKISISDLIKETERNGYSALDTDLINKVWNIKFLKELIVRNNTDTILCTSKFVLKNLEIRIVNSNNFGALDLESSILFQNQFINAINGNLENVTNPIARVFRVGNRSIKCVAIPSPGSPYRKLDAFGFDNGDRFDYATNYFSAAFNLLINN